MAKQSQLTLTAGGASVDASVIQSLRLAKDVGDVGDQFRKGDDVELRIKARVVDVAFKDKYDAHGNITETSRRHVLRIDDLDVVGVNQEAWKIAAEAQSETEDDAVSQQRIREQKEAAKQGAEPTPSDDPADGDGEDAARADLRRESADLAAV